MATADSIRKEFSIYEEATFGTSNGDWPNNGVLAYCFELDTSGLSHPTVANANYHTRPTPYHPGVLGLKSASTFGFATYLTATGTNAAEQAAGTAKQLQKLFRAAWGGMHASTADGFAGGSAAAPTVDTIGQWEIGDWMFAVDDTTGEGQFYKVVAKPGGAVLTLDRNLHFTPATADVAHAVIQVFLDTDALFDHTDSEYKTLQFLCQGHHTEDNYEILGCKPSVALDPIVQGQPVSARWTVMATDWNFESLSKETLTGTPEGQPPIITGSGDNTYFFWGNQGTHTSTVCLNFAPNIGVSWTPVDGPNGLEGRHHYVAAIGDITCDITLLFDDDHATDFAALTEKNALMQVSTDPLEAVGIAFPRLQITAKPGKGDAGGRATTTLSARALENDTSHSLTGQDKEKFLSPVSVLFVA